MNSLASTCDIFSKNIREYLYHLHSGYDIDTSEDVLDFDESQSLDSQDEPAHT